MKTKAKFPKVKHLALACAAACAAFGSAGSYAASCPSQLDPADPALAGLVTFYISGASAQQIGIENVAPVSVFATPTQVVHLKGTGASGTGGVPVDILGLTGSAIVSEGWLGCSIPSLTGGTSVPTLVIYNNTNGSAAGLNQLIQGTGYTGAEAYNLSVPFPAEITSSGTTATPDGSVTMPANYLTTNLAILPATTISNQVALSDVQPSEFAPGIVPAYSGMTVKKTGLEGFGIIVNPALYTDLQAQNIAEGLLPASCAGDNSTLSCQPSLRTADYAALTNSVNEGVNSKATLLPNVPTPSAGDGSLTLCRRDNFSGSQAAANIYFNYSVCGLKGYFGALQVASQADGAWPTANAFTVANNDTTGVVKNCVTPADASGGMSTGYALGSVSLGVDGGAYSGTYVSNPTGAKTWRFVKLDGVSPNTVGVAPATVSADPHIRANMINGSYKYAVDMSAMYKTAIAAPYSKMASALIANMQLVTKSNLNGIGYLPGSGGGTYGDGQTVKYYHQGNNCSPMH